MVLALRIALIAGATAAAYLSLALFDRPAYAGDRPARPGLIGGVLDVVAPVPRSLAGSGPSAGDRTGDGGRPPASSGAVRRAASGPSTGATTTPDRPSAAADPRRTGRVVNPGRSVDTPGRSLDTPGGAVDVPGRARAAGRPGERGTDVPGAVDPRGRWERPHPSRATPRPPASEPVGLGVVVAGLSGAVGRTAAGVPHGLAGVLPLAPVVTAPLLLHAPGAVVGVLGAVVHVGLGGTELLIGPVARPPVPADRAPPPPPRAGTAAPPGGSAPVTAVGSGASPAPVPPPDTPSANRSRSGCCAAGDDRARPVASRSLGLRVDGVRARVGNVRDRLPDLPAPIPFGHAGSGPGSGCGPGGANQFSALPPALPGWTDSVFVNTTRLADAVPRGRTPAVPALPG